MIMWTEQKLQNEIKKIPKESALKFYLDLQKLVKLAQKENYESFNF